MKLNIPTIRYWMTKRGMKFDADLARAMRRSKPTISRMLSGKQKGVSKVLLKDLAKVLDRPEGELVELENMPQTPFQRAVVAALPQADETVKLAIRTLLKLPDDERAGLLGEMRTVVFRKAAETYGLRAGHQFAARFVNAVARRFDELENPAPPADVAGPRPSPIEHEMASASPGLHYGMARFQPVWTVTPGR